MQKQQSSGHAPAAPHGLMPSGQIPSCSGTQEASARQAALALRFECAVPMRVNADVHLMHRGRTFSGDCMVHIGAAQFLLRIERGRVAGCTRQIPLFSNVLFTIKGSLAAWEALWEPMPQPGWHDIFALTKRGEMTMEGQMQPLFAHLQYIKDVLTAPRAEVTQ